MSRTSSGAKFDAVIIGSGPNGLAAAITLARAGCSTAIFEAVDEIGGGVRSGESTLPGFTHDLCSTIYPFADSAFFRTIPWKRLGVEWRSSPAAAAHPFDDAPAALIEGGVSETAAALGADERAYRKLMEPIAGAWPRLMDDLLAPVHRPAALRPFLQFALRGGLPATVLARALFRTEAARGLFAGLAAHSILPLEALATSSFGLVLAAAAHAAGWRFPQGGAGVLSAALAAYLRELGGTIITNAPVRTLAELPPHRAALFDTAPDDAVRIAGTAAPSGYSRRIRSFRRGPGVFKLDWALSAPIPWSDARCARAATVHLGGSLRDIALSERCAWRDTVARRPFVLLVQHTLFDPSRAPNGNHTAWAYCHVPNGYREDCTQLIEDQIERFAPGFRRIVLARSADAPAALEGRNANLKGGDITGGANNLLQLFSRPIASRHPYRLGRKGIYLCSASTPPGGGVHGMCGYYAARAALEDMRER